MLGVAVGFGVIYAWINSYLIVPALLNLLKPKITVFGVGGAGGNAGGHAGGHINGAGGGNPGGGNPGGGNPGGGNSGGGNSGGGNGGGNSGNGGGRGRS